MHIPDGLISGPINITSGVAAFAAVGVSAWHASREVEKSPHKLPLLATTGAFVFAAQMLNFPIGGGTSGHLMGSALIAALLGPWSACLIMALVLIIQCLVFADGGLSVLGTNIFNMGIIGGFSSYAIMRGLRSLLPVGRGGFLAVAAFSSWISILLAAVFCGFELAFSGTSPFGIVLPAMAGTHAIIGIGEALITTTVLSAVITARPDILPEWSGINSTAVHTSNQKRTWRLAGAGLVVAFVLGIFISPFASSSPDGLEKVAETKGFLELAEGAESWTSSPLPDYTIPGISSEGVSTGMAGLFGTALMFALGFALLKLINMRQKVQEN